MLNSINKINYSKKEGFIYNFKQALFNLLTDKMFYYTLISLFIKSIMFILLINSNKATKFNIDWAFYGIPHILVYLSFIILVISFSFIFKKRWYMWYLIGLNIFITIILIGDLWHYRAFNSFLTLHLLKETSNLDNLTSSIISMIRPIDLIFIIDIVIVIPLVIKLKNIYRTQKRMPSLFFIMAILSTTVIGLSHYKVDILEQGQKTILFRICWTPNQTMANLSPIGYHIYESYNYWLDSKPFNLKNEDKQEIESWFSDKNENLPDNKYSGMFKGKNLIVIQVESLENFVINQKIDGQEITPNINKFLKNGIYFSNYHEQVYNGTSSDADLLTNTSVYPVRSGSTFFRYPNNTYNSLPKLLEQQGYSTVAIHADKGSYWNWMPALNSIGFQRTIDSAHFNMDETIGLGLSDGSYLKQIEPIIKEQKQPFYSFLVTLTSHSPFDLPKEYRELNLDKKLDETKMGGYLQSIRYVDKHIGILVDKLEKEGILDNSVLAIYGDHTGIHKFYEDEVAKITPQEEWWKDNNLRVPLIIYEKNTAGEEIKTIGAQVDLFPTLAYVMGIKGTDYESTAMGRNLLNTNKNNTVLANGQYIGEKNSEKDEQNAVKGIELADRIIRSNYFKNYRK